MPQEDVAHNAISLFAFQNVGIEKLISVIAVHQAFYLSQLILIKRLLQATHLTFLWCIMFVLNAKDYSNCLEST